MYNYCIFVAILSRVSSLARLGGLLFYPDQDFDGAWWNFIPKVIADQTVWSVFLNAAYSTMIMSLQGLPRDEVGYHSFVRLLWRRIFIVFLMCEDNNKLL